MPSFVGGARASATITVTNPNDVPVDAQLSLQVGASSQSGGTQTIASKGSASWRLTLTMPTTPGDQPVALALSWGGTALNYQAGTVTILNLVQTYLDRLRAATSLTQCNDIHTAAANDYSAGTLTYAEYQTVYNAYVTRYNEIAATGAVPTAITLQAGVNPDVFSPVTLDTATLFARYPAISAVYYWTGQWQAAQRDAYGNAIAIPGIVWLPGVTQGAKYTFYTTGSMTF